MIRTIPWFATSDLLIRNIVAYFVFCALAITGTFLSRELTMRSFIEVLFIDTLVFLWFVFHNRVLFEKLLLREKYLLYGTLLLMGLALDLAISWFMVQRYSQVFAWPNYILAFLIYTAIAFFIYTSVKYFREKKAFYQATILKREAELQQLKSQLNPHFLFNSLNAVYSYNLENNAYGNDLILKLGQLMRFIIESQPKEFISIEEEIRFIEHYINFERERLGYRCDILYSSNIVSHHRQIPPLILFPFIENAFKHGTGTIRKTRIEISIVDSETSVQLHVRNEIVSNVTPSTKTGLSNVARRLELLFNEKHKLQMDSDQDRNEFSVKLELEF